MSDFYQRAKQLFVEEHESAPFVPCAHAREESTFSPSSSLKRDSSSLESTQGTNGAVTVPRSPSVENPQVTTSTPCQHVSDLGLIEWRQENPKLVCARCWLERSKELREDARATKATRRRHASRKTTYRGTIWGGR